MNFIKAVKALKSGKKVKRKSWSNDDGLIIVDEKFYTRIEWPMVEYKFSFEDTEVTDWEVIVEDKPKTLWDKKIPERSTMSGDMLSSDVKEAVEQLCNFLPYDIIRDFKHIVLKTKIEEIFGKEFLQ